MTTTDEEDYAERELRESIDDTLIMNNPVTDQPNTLTDSPNILTDRPVAADTAGDLLHWAWTFMCNAERCLTDSTDTRERAQWMDGFAKFRDRYHAYLDESRARDVEMETMKAGAAPPNRPLALDVSISGDANERLLALAHLVAQGTGRSVSLRHHRLASRLDITIGGSQ